MARTVDLKKRTEIAQRAFEVIKERGVHKTTMSDIAKALEMKRPALYHYFPNLEAIVLQVVEKLQREIRDFCVSSMARQRHPLDQLFAVVEATVAFYQTRQQDLVTIIQLWAVSSADARDEVLARERRALEPNRAFLVGLVKNGIDNGRIKLCDPVGLVDSILTLSDGSQLQLVTRANGCDATLAFIRKHLLEPLRGDAT